MPRRAIDSCLMVLEYFKQRGMQTCSFADMNLTIEQLIGADPRIAVRYLALLQKWGLIGPALSKPGEWALNFDKAYELNV